MNESFLQVYNDFTEKVLPKVGEGFQITKEYAFELSQRYATYNIIYDSVEIIMILGILFLFFKKEKSMRKYASDNDMDFLPQFLVLGIYIAAFFFLICIFFDIKDLIGWIYVPDVMIAKEILQATK